MSFLISPGRSHESDIHTIDLADFINIDLGKDDLFGNTERIISTAVKSFVADAPEVTDTRDGNGNQACREIHTSVRRGG